ncbi:MAG TPA: A/G-specific adenine glycosylase [Dyadobacter sp.]|jgi:A/G-specific adenine glycosylase|nr:A/G-specific adenine glycosylase [Dyadobacter sp.]
MLSDQLQIIDFNKRLKSWYVQNHRPLPWRETKDPYKIWLSEIILQQTRVAQGLPYYERFTEAYPTVSDLALAEEKDVLRLWQGLGYYSRARNMHFTARQIMTEFGGSFPSTAALLSKLKGLGQYTAAAVASFAFDEVVPAVDGNVYRVMARLFGIFTDILSNEGKKEFNSLAQQLVSREDPAIYNQAMIEFGAIQCVPVSPKCEVCIFADICYANTHKMQSQLPVKLKKLKVKSRYFNYFIVQNGNKIAMKERVGKDIWKGLYDFPMTETSHEVEMLDDLPDNQAIGKILPIGLIRNVPKTCTHLLTHQKLFVRFWWIDITHVAELADLSSYHFFDADEVANLPKPILVDMVLKEEGFI